MKSELNGHQRSSPMKIYAYEKTSDLRPPFNCLFNGIDIKYFVGTLEIV